MIRIGIDIGGSHVGVGIVKNGAIVNFADRDLNREDRLNIKEALVNTIIELINEALDDSNLGISDIDLIGIAAPRNNKK